MRAVALCAMIALLSSCTRSEGGPTAPLDRAMVPEPVFDAKPHLVVFYWTAWEQVWQHVRSSNRVPRSPFLDEGAIPGRVWIWDTVFMAHFCKYAPAVCPAAQSLENIYAVLYDQTKSEEEIHHPDNPPILAWAEWELYRMTGDRERLRWLLETKRYLQRHLEWFDKVRRAPSGDYTWSGNSSGMDNTPRGRGAGGHAEIYWFDAMAQQALSARLISRMAEEIGDQPMRDEYRGKAAALGRTLNKVYWDGVDGIYYDVKRADVRRRVPVKTPAAYWPMLAEVSSPAQAARLRAAAIDPWIFGGPAPFPSVARSDPDFDPGGRYWRGSVWLPMVYLAAKALAAYGYSEDADRAARAVLEQQYQTFLAATPHTIWEAYSPSQAKWATTGAGRYPVRTDFCGWSALGPIALFIESYLGFHTVDALHRLVEWRKVQPGRHGIRRLRFGSITTDIIGDGDRLYVKSNGEYTLRVNDIAFQVRAGEQTFHLPIIDEQRQHNASNRFSTTHPPRL